MQQWHCLMQVLLTRCRACESCSGSSLCNFLHCLLWCIQAACTTLKQGTCR